MSSCSCIALMRATDVGCGNGEVTLLLADSAGNEGQVDGIDISKDAIEAAENTAQKSGKENVKFQVSDISSFETGQYDAIFGRRVLMYQSDPVAIIRRLKRLLKPDGIMLFQESDENGALLNGPDLPLHNQAQDWIWKTVKHEGGHTHIGSELYGMMKSAGMHIVDYCSEAALQTAETGSDLAWVVSVMQERMRAAGLHPETDQLEKRLQEEMDHADRAFVRDLAFGICAKKT